jgi:hypothetical protein
LWSGFLCKRSAQHKRSHGTNCPTGTICYVTLPSKSSST